MQESGRRGGARDAEERGSQLQMAVIGYEKLSAMKGKCRGAGDTGKRKKQKSRSVGYEELLATR